ncbi:MAG: hypothetical protein IPJ77_09785 [Planctomycetes bacterium]|nr:hypothetical protein [Planctomycetota bacterium]
MRRALDPVVLTLVLAAPCAARAFTLPQDPPAATPEQGFELVELRVTSSRPRAALVDHGSVDGIALQDRVTFRLRDGRTFGGTVSELQERSAVVLLDDPAFVPAPGTKGDVRVPSERLAPKAKPPASAPAPEAPAQPAVEPELPWTNQDDEWTPGEPLLARVRAIRPSERAARITGRWYAIGDVLGSSDGPRTDTFLRVGAGAEYENAFGNGGVLRVDGELNYRRTDVPDGDDDQAERARLDRLSYTLGGTRFDATRLEFGRFLQHSVPEFGVLDGFEWSRRLSGGSSFGASVGFLPEPDAEQSTLTDLQFAAFGRWVNDESETASATVGFQKTFHDFAADRDLLVAKLEVVPRDAWTMRGTIWVDVYGSTDAAKGAGVEVTQAVVNTSRRWSDGGYFGLTYTHFAFPELERDEFLPVTDAQLADDHTERVALAATKPLSDSWRANVDVGAWIDEDDDGANGELGFVFDDVIVDGGELELAGFADKGRYTSTVGGRCSLGHSAGSSRWHVDYEFARHLFEGFGTDNNELPQHRVRASWDWTTEGGWSISTHVEGQLFDDETGYAAGFYLQRSF